MKRQWILRLACTLVLLLVSWILWRFCATSHDSAMTITDAPYRGHTALDSVLVH